MAISIINSSCIEKLSWVAKRLNLFLEATTMINFDKYRVNPKKFSLKDYNSKDKSERTGSKEQNALDLTATCD